MKPTDTPPTAARRKPISDYSEDLEALDALDSDELLESAADARDELRQSRRRLAEVEAALSHLPLDRNKKRIAPGAIIQPSAEYKFAEARYGVTAVSANKVQIVSGGCIWLDADACELVEETDGKD